MEYNVLKANSCFDFSDSWDQGGWANAEIAEIKSYMGDKPVHLPKTQVKVLYDDQKIYVYFKVQDQYLRAVAEKFQDPVCRDSCVEFFFVPGSDLATGYFNFEVNCGGTFLIYHQTALNENQVKLSEDDIKLIKVEKNMPKIVDPEIKESTEWFIKYSFNIDMLSKYCKVDKPCSGAKWRGNFYKCGDRTSHPHWITWSEVDSPEPDFHVPTSFGVLNFK